MNNTKKLTQGAMLLAIVGALMVIDRQLSFVFTEFIILAMPVIIIIYSTKYELKDGVILTICLIFLVFILGDLTMYLFLPTAVFVGLAYSWGVKKDFSKRKLMGIAIIIYVIGEFITTLLIQPLFGVDIFTQFNAMIAEADKVLGGMMSKTLGDSLNKLLNSIIPVAILLTGVLEGFLIHLLTLIFFRRFKIKEVVVTSPLDFRIHPVVAYVCFLSLFGNLYLINYGSDNMIVYTIISTLSTLGAILLFYVGYLFIINYGVVVLHKNLTLIAILFFMLLFPVSVLTIEILGFLYGAGPLARYLDNKRSETNEKSN